LLDLLLRSRNTAKPMSANSPITAATEAPTIPPVLMDEPRCEGELLDEVALFELDVMLVEEVE
jgi:hypothetical protein